jgi:hypothetical protein
LPHATILLQWTALFCKPLNLSANLLPKFRSFLLLHSFLLLQHGILNFLHAIILADSLKIIFAVANALIHNSDLPFTNLNATTLAPNPQLFTLIAFTHHSTTLTLKPTFIRSLTLILTLSRRSLNATKIIVNLYLFPLTTNLSKLTPLIKSISYLEFDLGLLLNSLKFS